MGDGEPAPRIPARAWEKVTDFDASGSKTNSEFWFKGRLVGRADWYPDGTPALVVGLRNGLPDGYLVEYHESGAISFAEPYVKGLAHGLARQYDEGGKLLLVSPFVRGTGIDFWCDPQGKLAEEHPLVGGKPSGRERWWNPDGKTVYSETDYRDGQQHGVARGWSGRKLQRGFPKFFLDGDRVSRRVYLRAARADPTIPSYRPEEDLPDRDLPIAFKKLRVRTARIAASARPARSKAMRPISEEPIIFERVIAERRYQAGDEWILLQIGSPRRASWKTDFYCPIRLVGRKTVTLRAFGVDSVQALILAVDLARTTLRQWKPAVFWEGGERIGDVGISRTVGTGMGLEFDLELETMIDRTVAAKATQLQQAARKRSKQGSR